MARRRVNALAVHQGDIPTSKAEWRGGAGGGRGGSSCLSIRRDALRPQWTTRLQGRHRYVFVIKPNIHDFCFQFSVFESSSSLSFSWMCCLWLSPLAHRAVERRRIWTKTTRWVKTPVQSFRMISRTIQSSRSGSPSPPRRLPPRRRPPGPHVGDGNPAHPPSQTMRIALLHQR